ncbi:MAG: hypothetical protein L3J32_04390 [Rhizobiaceae bacterium]|nr:hypothetical protein [Rhizobiaceae bacterium]
MPNDNSIYDAAQTLSKILRLEISNLKGISQVQDFERRTKSLTAMSKAVQAFNEFAQQLKSNSKDDDGSIGSVVEFRQELARRIRGLVSK